MTAKAFADTLKKIPVVKEWASDQRGVTGVLQQTRKSSESEIQASIVDFRLSKDQLATILGNDSTANAIFKQISSTGNYAPVVAAEPGSIEHYTANGREYVIFNSVKFSGLNNTISKYLERIAKDAGLEGPSEGLAGRVSNFVSTQKYEKGHVYGWANTLVYRTRTDILAALTDPARQTADFKPVPQEQLAKEIDALDNFINALLDNLEAYDELVSGIDDINSPVYAKYRKTDNRWLIQWEAKVGNLAAGNVVGRVVGTQKTVGIRGFLKEAGYSTSQNLVDTALKNMLNSFVKEGLSSAGSSNFLRLETSPKLIEMIEDTLLSSMRGTKKKFKDAYTGTLDKLVTIPVTKVVNKAKAVASARRAKAELRNLKNKAAAAKRKINKSVAKDPPALNLLSLTNIINSGLHDRLRENMGTGSRRDVLNYRTGRFASSVKIDHLTISRQGMLTAFYTYMKNPYATFSAGGRREYPRSRDPKLLISKSIRELAAQQVTNQLRAVLI